MEAASCPRGISLAIQGGHGIGSRRTAKKYPHSFQSPAAQNQRPAFFTACIVGSSEKLPGQEALRVR
jgi:hypothetical protein